MPNLAVQCPECSCTIQILGPYESLYDIRYATFDCPNCHTTLLCTKELLIVDLHKYLHEQDPQWPADGKGTGYVTLES